MAPRRAVPFIGLAVSFAPSSAKNNSGDSDSSQSIPVATTAPYPARAFGPQPRINRQRIARDGHARAKAEIRLVDVARLDQRVDAVEALGISSRDRHRARGAPTQARGRIGQQAGHVVGRDLVISFEQAEPQQRRVAAASSPSTGSNAAAAS